MSNVKGGGMDFQQGINRFVMTFNQSKQSMGEMKIAHNKIMVNRLNSIPLKGELLQFYENTELTDSPSFGGDFYLQVIDLSIIEKVNEDWRAGGEWQNEFVIFAERNGDVLYCDLSGCDNPVFGSIQKRNFIVAESLLSFMNVYCDLVEIEELEYGCETTDEDFNFKDDYLLAVKDKLKQQLNEDCSRGFERFFLL